MNLSLKVLPSMSNIKSHDNYVKELNHKRSQLMDEINQFYKHAKDVTSPHFSHFNTMSFFHDVNQYKKC